MSILVEEPHLIVFIIVIVILVILIARIIVISALIVILFRVVVLRVTALSVVSLPCFQLRRGRFDALDTLRPVAKKHGLSEVECALRWLSHHSQLKAEKGDGIIIGASSLKHLEENLVALSHGPLPEYVVEAIN
ncbi:Aldo/keto reductase [Penicillium malachiteum]|nr:Aldo/keto reductase [Penicillium malachiteum]